MSIFNPKIDVLKAEDYKDVSINDKAELSFKQGKLWRNYNLKDVLITTAGVGAAAGTAAAVAKSRAAQHKIIDAVDKLNNTKFSQIVEEKIQSVSSNKYVKKAVEWVKNLPTAAQVAGISVLALVGLARRINKNKAIAKSGALVQQTIDENKIKNSIKE